MLMVLGRFLGLSGEPHRICQRDHRAERAPLRFSHLQPDEARRRGVELPLQTR
jgi:hypothetical protein